MSRKGLTAFPPSSGLDKIQGTIAEDSRAEDVHAAARIESCLNGKKIDWFPLFR